MRGEHSSDRGRHKGDRGSSPHAWGTRGIRDIGDRPRRFIPTCVGNTSRGDRRNQSKSVHPHMRGEHIFSHAGALQPCGSSPHAWGTPAPMVQGSLYQRFIPTCVGNTLSGRTFSSRNSVHPHMRGEHLASWTCWSNSFGSSPHAWGTRTTPTTPLPGGAVHPHMRGEHQYKADSRTLIIGSSPHAWGTR